LLDHRPELAALVSRWAEPGSGERRLLSLLRGSRMKRLLRRLLDESEFLSDFGIRSLSRRHRDEPFHFALDGYEATVRYDPADSTLRVFGGNSNWRGPIWMPINYLVIHSLRRFHRYYGDDFKVEHPTGSGQLHTLAEVATRSRRDSLEFFCAAVMAIPQSSVKIPKCRRAQTSPTTGLSTSSFTATPVTDSGAGT